MTIGAVKPFTTTMTSGSTLTNAVDLAGGYNNVMIVIPTMTSGTDIRLKGSEELDGTYRAIYLEPKVGSTTPTLFNIASSVTNCMFPISVSNQYVKVEFTTACTASAHVFKFICNAN